MIIKKIPFLIAENSANHCGNFNLAKQLELKVNTKPISIEMLKSSDELFATSTAGGVMPITKVSGTLIGSGKVGNITRKIHKIYW